MSKPGFPVPVISIVANPAQLPIIGVGTPPGLGKISDGLKSARFWTAFTFTLLFGYSFLSHNLIRKFSVSPGRVAGFESFQVPMEFS